MNLLRVLLFICPVFIFQPIHEIVVESEFSSVSTSQSFILEFASTRIIYNDHVGNEWQYAAIVNDKILYRGDKIRINFSELSQIELVSYVSETKEKYNDHAKETHLLDLSDFLKYEGSGFYVDVIIQESNGRYAGNTAKMRFNYYIN